MFRHRRESDNECNQIKKKTVKRKAAAVPQAPNSASYDLFVDLQTGGLGYLYYSESRVLVAMFDPKKIDNLASRSIWPRMWVENENRRFFIIQGLNSSKLKQGKLT